MRNLSSFLPWLILSVLLWGHPAWAEDDAYRIGTRRCPPISILRPEVCVFTTQEQFEAVQAVLTDLKIAPKLVDVLSKLTMATNWPSGLKDRQLVEQNIAIFPRYRCYLIGSVGKYSMLFVPKAENQSLPAQFLPEGDFFCVLAVNTGLPNPLPQVSEIQEAPSGQTSGQPSSQPQGGGLVIPVSVGDIAHRHIEATTPPKEVRKTLGKVEVIYVEPSEKSSFARFWHDRFSSNDSLFTQFAFDFERQFKLPRRLEVVLADLDVANCWYSPKDHRVTITYKMLQECWEYGKRKGSKDEKDLAVFMVSCMYSLFFHEMGHAILGEMGIPSVGREEDTVDEFSVLWMLKSGDRAAEEIVGNTVDLWNLMGSDTEKHPFYDEHSLSQQRAFSLLLLLYAHNPEPYEKLVASVAGERSMARARLQLPKKKASWNKLLQPYLKQKTPLFK